jgi:hypothetical protein
MFHVSADPPPTGGQDPIRRVLFVTGADQTPRKLLEIIRERNATQGQPAAQRADLRFDQTTAGQIYVINKADGVIRVILK